MHEGYIDDMDYQGQQYRDKYEKAQKELDKLTASFNEIVNALKSRSDNIDLNFEDFKFYFLKAAHSDNPAMHDQFESLMFVSKLLFGEELQEIKSKIERAKRNRLEKIKQDNKLEREYEKEYLSRQNDKECIIKRLKELLIKIASSRIKLEDLENYELSDAKMLLKANNLKISIIFKRLVVKDFINIPLEFDDDYYKATDHPGYYLSTRFRPGFYGCVWL